MTIRAYRATPEATDEAFRALERRLAYARNKHPEGTNLFDLISECHELHAEMSAKPIDLNRVRDEALDVAVCALRIYLQEEPPCHPEDTVPTSTKSEPAVSGSSPTS